MVYISRKAKVDPKSSLTKQPTKHDYFPAQWQTFFQGSKREN